jgi:hypothetical protein
MHFKIIAIAVAVKILMSAGPVKYVTNDILLPFVTESPREGVRRQDQLERFSVKREHNQHT